jgi:hypothetical protein
VTGAITRELGSADCSKVALFAPAIEQ